MAELDAIKKTRIAGPMLRRDWVSRIRGPCRKLKLEHRGDAAPKDWQGKHAARSAHVTTDRREAPGAPPLTPGSVTCAKAGPDRAVGRRKGTKLTDRVSVTLRIDRELWAQFLYFEQSRVIDDRTRTINGWFREKLAELKREGLQS